MPAAVSPERSTSARTASATGTPVASQAATAPAAPAAPSARRLETRTKLLDAAFAVFTETGLQAASVEQITSRAGFTRGAFYSNFSSKEELFAALLDRAYTQRAAELRARTEALIPHLVAKDGPITYRDAARFVGEFFRETGDEASWFALEAEFLLLSLRDHTQPNEFTDFVGRFRAELAQIIEAVVSAAGRSFVLPIDHAMPILGGVYDRAFRITALAGYDAPEGIGELGERIAELIFAITEEIARDGGA